MSARETIVAAVAAKLVAAGVAGGRVYRSRREQIGTLPAVEVWQDGAATSAALLGVDDHELRIRVAVLANGDIPDQAADAVLVAAHAALLADLTLGIADVQLDPDNWSAEAPEFDDFDYTRFAHLYTVRYRTAPGAF